MEYLQLKDVCYINMGQSPDSSSYNDCGEGLPFFQGNADFGERYPVTRVWSSMPTKKANANDILISVRAPIGALNYAKELCCIGRGLAALTPNTEKVSPEFIFWMLKGKNAELKSKGTGSTFKAISKKVLEEIKVPNIDLDTQKVYSGNLEKTYKIIQLRKQQLQQLDELVKARFVELMNSNPSHNFLSDFIVSYKAERCGDRDLPVLSITKDDGIVLQNEKFKKRIASVDASTYKIVPRGKLVQGIHIDERNFAIQNIVDEGIVSPAYKIWTVDTTKAIPEVLAFALRTDRTMAYISSKFAGSIKRRESISISDFMATPIDLPNILVQNEFADFVKEIDKSKFVEQKYIKKLEILRLYCSCMR